MRLYERPDWQAQALKTVPVAKLVQRAADAPEKERKVGLCAVLVRCRVQWLDGWDTVAEVVPRHRPQQTTVVVQVGVL